MKRSPTFAEPLVCVDCGVTVVRRSPGQRYCETCSIIRDRDRKAAWSRTNAKPKTSDQGRAARAQTKAKRAQIRAELAGPPSGPTYETVLRDGFVWFVEIRVPFSYAFSKNAVWSMAGGGGHVFMRRRASEARSVVSHTMRAALARFGLRPVEAKVYIEITVEKTNHRGDAINVLDSVCDGLKEALEVDDRWFSLLGLDWSIRRVNPVVTIGVGQKDTEPMRPCSTCGVVKPLTDFGLAKHVRLGRARQCRACGRSVMRVTALEGT